MLIALSESCQIRELHTRSAIALDNVFNAFEILCQLPHVDDIAHSDVVAFTGTKMLDL